MYHLILSIRNFLYNKGIRKSTTAAVPTVSLGNVTVGGTGKTPHTEMLVRIFKDSFNWGGRRIGILSRGYKRRTKGYREVLADGRASEYGDEPLQMKRKFPDVTVAVDKNRVEGCSKMPVDLIILDDAFQYRKLKPSLSIVLVDYNRPVLKDRLLPFGSLRDLPKRIGDADALIMTKCPYEMDNWERTTAAYTVGMNDYLTSTCEGTGLSGKKQMLFFTRIEYCPMEPVFPDADNRYMYSKKLVLFTGIAKDEHLKRYLSDTYELVGSFRFPDHHRFRKSDFRRIVSVLKSNPVAAVATTEKDAQRVRDCKGVPSIIRERLFCVPIKVDFLSEDQKRIFTQMIISI